MWSYVGLWALRNWKAIALVLLIASVLGYTYHKGKQAERDRVQAAQAKEQVQALQHELAASRAALEAAQAARGRNDEVIPKARRATADRIARADSADADQRLLDDRAAEAEYAAAASLVRGKGAR